MDRVGDATATMTRRALLQRSFAAWVAALTSRPFGVDAAATPWLQRVQQLAVAVHRHRMSPRQWRRRMLDATRPETLGEILGLFDLQALIARMPPSDAPEPQTTIVLPPLSGERDFAFSALLSHIRAGYAVVPHGHRNMVSMHCILRGHVRLQQYDRLGADAEALLIRQTTDRVLGPGDAASISADRGNVHWFQGVTDAWALIIGAYDLAPHGTPHAREYVDPLAGDRHRDGRIRAPRLTVAAAYRRYLRV